MVEITLDVLGKRLDELQVEATHYRLDFDVILKEVRELTSRMDTLASRMNLLDNRMDRVEARLDKLEARMDRLEARMDGLEAGHRNADR